MAQKVTGYIKLQIPAAKATASPPVGPALGQHGVNIAQFIKEFNERTKDQAGFKIPVVITVYADRSFTFITQGAARPAPGAGARARPPGPLPRAAALSRRNIGWAMNKWR